MEAIQLIYGQRNLVETSLADLLQGATFYALDYGVIFLIIRDS